MNRTPNWLDKDGKDLYKRLRKKCKGEDTLLLAYCQAFAELKLATKTMQTEGRYFTTKTGFMIKHPAFAQQKSAMSSMNQLGMRLGLDKATYTPEESTKWDAFK